MKLRLLAIALFLLLPVLPLLTAQTKPTAKPPAKALLAAPTVGNPVAVEFEFADWMQASGYEVDIADATTLAVRQTMKFAATPAVTNTITIHLAVNVQPVAMGTYVFLARGVMPNGPTPSSEPSDPWQRLAGPPGKPVALGK